MNGEYDERGADGIAHYHSYFVPLDRNEDKHYFSQDIGDQLGLSYRAPTFSQEALMSRTRDYVSAPANWYATDEFNRRLLGDSDDAVWNAVKREIGAGATVQVNVSGQLGIIAPIIGFGPYAGVSISAGYTAAGDTFLQVQGSLGAGMGTFYSIGTGNPVMGGGSLVERWEGAWRGELNAGLGPSSITGTLNPDLSGTINWSQLLSPVLSKGRTEGLAISGVYGMTYTIVNPELHVKKVWDEISASLGRDIYQVEVNIRNFLMTQ